MAGSARKKGMKKANRRSRGGSSAPSASATSSGMRSRRRRWRKMRDAFFRQMITFLVVIAPVMLPPLSILSVINVEALQILLSHFPQTSSNLCLSATYSQRMSAIEQPKIMQGSTSDSLLPPNAVPAFLSARLWRSTSSSSRSAFAGFTAAVPFSPFKAATTAAARGEAEDVLDRATAPTMAGAASVARVPSLWVLPKFHRAARFPATVTATEAADGPTHMNATAVAAPVAKARTTPQSIICCCGSVTASAVSERTSAAPYTAIAASVPSNAAAAAASSCPATACCGGKEATAANAQNHAAAHSSNKVAAAEAVVSHVVPRVGESTAGPRPDWFHVPAPHLSNKEGEESRYQLLQKQLRGLKLHTVCEEAKCPNIGECWNGGTATIMLLGDTCTRGCRFCAIKTSGKPPPADPLEPEKVAAAVAQWDVDYLVLTSVDRDDMPDGGADHFTRTVQLIKEKKPSILIECLVSDFQGAEESVRRLATRSGLDVYAHNVETVRRLTPYVRDKRAKYEQSLRVLQLAKSLNNSLFTKSSLMLGLGETEEEVVATLRDLRQHDVDVVTFGQYLRPSKQQLGVVEYVAPAVFDKYREIAEQMGFKYVASGPLVRSSYKAGEYFMKHLVEHSRKHGSTLNAPASSFTHVKLEADVGHLHGKVTDFTADSKTL